MFYQEFEVSFEQMLAFGEQKEEIIPPLTRELDYGWECMDQIEVQSDYGFSFSTSEFGLENAMFWMDSTFEHKQLDIINDALNRYDDEIDLEEHTIWIRVSGKCMEYFLLTMDFVQLTRKFSEYSCRFYCTALQEYIYKLKNETKYSCLDPNAPDDECKICMEEKCGEIIRTNCGHYFCITCAANIEICPFCRQIAFTYK